MTKEEFANKLIESIENSIFGELKDTAVRTYYIQRKYEGSGINVQRVYRRIVNYQIIVYGQQLTCTAYTYLRNKEEKEKSNLKARQRRYYRRKENERTV